MATSQYAHSEASLVQIEEMTKLSSQVHNALTGLIESNMQSADITVVSGLLASVRDFVLVSLLPPYEVPLQSLPRILRCLLPERSFYAETLRAKSSLWLRDDYVGEESDYFLRQFCAAGRLGGDGSIGAHFESDGRISSFETIADLLDDANVIQDTICKLLSYDPPPTDDMVNQYLRVAQKYKLSTQNRIVKKLISDGPIHLSQIPHVIQCILFYQMPIFNSYRQDFMSWLDASHKVHVNNQSWIDGQQTVELHISELGWINIREHLEGSPFINTTFLNSPSLDEPNLAQIHGSRPSTPMDIDRHADYSSNRKEVLARIQDIDFRSYKCDQCENKGVECDILAFQDCCESCAIQHVECTYLREDLPANLLKCFQTWGNTSSFADTQKGIGPGVKTIWDNKGYTPSLYPPPVYPRAFSGFFDKDKNSAVQDVSPATQNAIPSFSAQDEDLIQISPTSTTQTWREALAPHEILAEPQSRPPSNTKNQITHSTSLDVLSRIAQISVELTDLEAHWIQLSKRLRTICMSSASYYAVHPRSRDGFGKSALLVLLDLEKVRLKRLRLHQSLSKSIRSTV